MNKYYKDRDFPEVKVSNADIVAVIENPEQLERVVREQNELVDRIWALESAARSLRNAQRAYMSNRGNQELGKAVAVAAKALDVVLGDA
jgi:hypothetical protein